MLEGIFAQNLILVGKAPAARKAPFNMRLPILLGILVFMGVFIAAETLGSRISQSLGIFNEMSEPAALEEIMRASTDFAATGSSPAALPLPGPPQRQKAASGQIFEDKRHAREYVNLIIQSLEDKSEMQDYGNLLSDSPVPIKKMFGLGIKTIIIDAGHGGEDPGAVGSMGLYEKDVTLDISRKLKARLEARGSCRVILTRTKDTYISLKERTIIANESGGDLFVSVHVNFLPGRSLNMIETLYFGPSKNSSEMKLAEKENEGSGFSISDYNQLIKKLSNTMKLQESRLLAQSIQQHLFQSMHTLNKSIRDHGVKRAPFVVLLGAEMPGVLVEVTCLSNPDEEQRLRDPAYRDSIAGYIETGIIKYLESRSTDHDSTRADRDVERNLFRRN